MAVKSVNLENDGHEKEQIIGFIKQAGCGLPIKDLCRKGGFSDAAFYKWRAKYGGLDVPEARRHVQAHRAAASSRAEV